MIAESISREGGGEAVNLQITEDYLTGLGGILSVSKTTILPAELANIAGVFEGLSKVTGKLPEIRTPKEKEAQ